MIYDDLTVAKLPEDILTEQIKYINENPTDYIKLHIAVLVIRDSVTDVVNELPEAILTKPIFSYILFYHLEAKAVLSAMKENKGLFKIEAAEMESIKSILNDMTVKANPILENQVKNIKRLRNEEFLYYLFHDYENPNILTKFEEGLKDYDSINFKDCF